MVVGLGLAAATDAPILKMVVACDAAWGFFSNLPVFRPLPMAFLSGAGAAAGIAAANSIGNLGGFFGPKVFGYLKDATGGDSASLIFLACSAVIGIILVLVIGHNPALERAAKQPV
ncbi:MAG: hypothetical protein ACLQE9_12470 [Roseiarcus sp.]